MAGAENDHFSTATLRMRFPKSSGATHQKPHTYFLFDEVALRRGYGSHILNLLRSIYCGHSDSASAVHGAGKRYYVQKVSVAWLKCSAYHTSWGCGKDTRQKHEYYCFETEGGKSQKRKPQCKTRILQDAWILPQTCWVVLQVAYYYTV